MDYLLPRGLSVGTSLLGLADLMSSDWGDPQSYRRMGKIALIMATALDQINTLYTYFGLSYPALKYLEGTALVAGIACILAEKKWEVAKPDQLPRVMVNALNAARLVIEMGGNTLPANPQTLLMRSYQALFGGHQQLQPLNSLWHTLVSFEICGRLLLIDRQGPARDHQT